MKDWRSYFTPLLSLENADNILKEYLEDCNFKVIKFHDIKNEKIKFRNIEKYISKYVSSRFNHSDLYFNLNFQK